MSYEIHDKNKTRKRRRGRRRKRRISHRVLDHTYPELSVARATLVKMMKELGKASYILVKNYLIDNLDNNDKKKFQK